MDRFDVLIRREISFSQSIVGKLSVGGSFICYTLELPWRWNERSVSCVPPGRYDGFLRYDKPDGWRIQLMGVPSRGGVQIHVGNYPRHTKGCVLVGTSYAPNAVLNSKTAYGKLKDAFYGDLKGKGTPDRTITVEFQGILSTPWGDYVVPDRSYAFA